MNNGLIPILQIVRPCAGGMRRHVQILLTGLDRNRFRLSIAARAREWETFCHQEEIELFRLPAFDVAAAWQLRRYLRHYNGILHVHGARAALWAHTAPSRLSVIYTAHGAAGRQPLERFLVWRADTVIAVSATQSHAWGKGTVLIPNGIPWWDFILPESERLARRAALLTKLPANNHPFIIGAAARLVPGKGLETLLHACHKTQNDLPGLGIVIAGSGSQWDFLRDLANRLGLANRVVLLGHCQDMPGFFAALDLFVHPSQHEGLPLVLLEAMAAAVPVVASDIPGCRDALGEQGGVLVPPADSAQLAKTIIALARDPERRRTTAVAGRCRVKTHFSATLMVKRVTELYEQVWEK